MATANRAIKTKRINVPLDEGETALVHRMMDYTGMNISNLVRALINSGARTMSNNLRDADGLEPAGPIPKYLTPADQETA